MSAAQAWQFTWMLLSSASTAGIFSSFCAPQSAAAQTKFSGFAAKSGGGGGEG